jgi:hypothetical protein
VLKLAKSREIVSEIFKNDPHTLYDINCFVNSAFASKMFAQFPFWSYFAFKAYVSHPDLFLKYVRC